MPFHSYYWNEHEFASPRLQVAWQQLRVPEDDEARLAAFQALLHDESVAAQCIALDHHAYMESQERHGARNPFAGFADEVRKCARQRLRDDAFPGEAAGGVEPGASHASALGALLNLAKADDAALVARALSRTASRSVLHEGVRAARAVLGDAGNSGGPPDRSLIAALQAIVQDGEQPDDLRAAAIMAFADCRTPDITSVLREATGLGSLRLQATAAWLLADDLDLHRPLIETLVASWPADPPYPASEVIEILKYDAD